MSTIYAGFSYGVGREQDLATPHRHFDGGLELEFSHDRESPSINHIGYTLRFDTSDTTQKLPMPDQDYLNNVVSSLKSILSRSGISLLSQPVQSTEPSITLDMSPEKGIWAAIGVGSGDAAKISGKSVTSITFRLPKASHGKARQIAKSLDVVLMRDFFPDRKSDFRNGFAPKSGEHGHHSPHN